MDFILLLGKVLFGGYFFYGGINHFLNLKMMTGYAQMKGVPIPSIAVPLTGVLILAGGLSLLFDFYPFYGCLAIILFLLPTTLMMHNFWSVQDPQQKMGDQINFFKNMALLGAALMLSDLLVK